MKPLSLSPKRALLRYDTVFGFSAILMIFTAGIFPAHAAADVCAGLVQDKQFRQEPSVSKPPYLQAFTDPNFGTTIRRITNVSPSEGENAIIKPIYSTIQAWNADESYLLLHHRGGPMRGHELYDGKTYQLIRKLGDLIQPSDLEQVLWDPEDSDVFYYPSTYTNIPNFYRYRVGAAKNEPVRNFADVCGASATLSLGSDPMYLSWANGSKVVGLQCGQDKKFLYDIKGNSVLGTLATPLTWFAPQPGPSGQLALGYGNVYNASLQVVRTLNLKNAFDHPEHGSIGRTSDGHDAYYAVVFDTMPGQEVSTLTRFDLDTGAERPIIAQSTGWINKEGSSYYPPSNTHISALAYNNPDWIGVSVVGSPPFDRVPGQEILVANGRTGAVCRVANHHSIAGSATVSKWGYWAEPHVVISPSATRLIFGSDWDNGDSVDTYVVELPSYTGGPPPQPQPGDLNADNAVNVIDLGILLSAWGATDQPPADINQDSAVDVTDLGILLSSWG